MGEREKKDQRRGKGRGSSKYLRLGRTPRTGQKKGGSEREEDARTTRRANDPAVRANGVEKSVRSTVIFNSNAEGENHKSDLID